MQLYLFIQQLIQSYFFDNIYQWNLTAATAIRYGKILKNYLHFTKNEIFH